MTNTRKHIVITGSTRGIGYGLAQSFLALGCSVTVGGRGEMASVETARRLASAFEAQQVLGLACDVTIPAQVQALWDKSVERFDKVDIWVNNAGWSGDEGMVWDLPAGEIESIISTNILGTAYGAQTALRGMLKQGFGAIYNMEGMGGDGRKHAGLTMYGTTKYAIHYFTESLALEARHTPIVIGSLRPGMVITDLIVDRYKDRPVDWERAKKVFNIIAERIETVTPWLARQMLANQRRGAVLSYSSNIKMIWRFASSILVKRDLFS